MPCIDLGQPHPSMANRKGEPSTRAWWDPPGVCEKVMVDGCAVLVRGGAPSCIGQLSHVRNLSDGQREVKSLKIVFPF